MFEFLKKGRNVIYSAISRENNQYYTKWTEVDNYEKLMKEGFLKNNIIYSCMEMITKAVSSVPFRLYTDDSSNRKEIKNHQLSRLLKYANDREPFSEFISRLVAHLWGEGNSYTLAVKADGVVRELIPIRPDMVKLEIGTLGVNAYTYVVNDKIKARWRVNPVTGDSDIMHIKEYHPLEHYYGLSHIRAASHIVDLHNSFIDWNKRFMDNNACPSGLLISKGRLPEKTRQQLKEQMERYKGILSSGRVAMIDGADISWSQVGLSPKEIDFLDGKNATAHDIAIVMGVPPVLIVRDNDTFNNAKEGRLALWETTIMYILTKVRDHLNMWLLPKFDKVSGLIIDFDTSKVPALISKRANLFELAIKAREILTINESRALINYPPVDGGNEIYIQGGRNTFDGIASQSQAEPDSDKINGGE